MTEPLIENSDIAMLNATATVAVNQLDRDAAQALLASCAKTHWYGMYKGEGDSDPFVQAFAKHRLAIVEAARADDLISRKAALAACDMVSLHHERSGISESVSAHMARRRIAALPAFGENA